MGHRRFYPLPTPLACILASYVNEEDAPTLPLFCYTAVGWHDDKFYVPAVRIEPDIRQENAGFDDDAVERGAGSSGALSQQPHRGAPGEQLRPDVQLPAARKLLHGALGVPGADLPGLQLQLRGLYLLSAG